MPIKILQVGVRQRVVPMPFPVVPAPGLDWQGSINAPTLALSVDWIMWDAQLAAPLPEIQGEFGWFINLTAPAAVLNSAINTGEVFSAEIETTKLLLSGFMERPWAASVDAVLPTISGFIAEQIFWNASLVTPVPFFDLVFVVTDRTSPKVWVVNPENKAHSVYENFDCSDIMELDGVQYGLFPDGLYQLTGDKDGTTDIDAELVWAQTDLGDSIRKRVDAIFANLRNLDAGEYQFTVKIDETEERIYSKDISHSEAGMRQYRVLLPRGLAGQNWQFGLRNVNGADFTIQGLQTMSNKLARHNR